MKLYLFDAKHEQVLDEMQITNVREVSRMVNFLRKNNLTSNYANFIIAENYHIEDYEGERVVIFEYGGN